MMVNLELVRFIFRTVKVIIGIILLGRHLYNFSLSLLYYFKFPLNYPLRELECLIKNTLKISRISF